MRAFVTFVALFSFLFAQGADAGPWQARTAGTLSQTADAATAATPPNVMVGDLVPLVTMVNANGAARTLATPGGWNLCGDVLSGNAAVNGKVFCRIWQMGDVIPALDWSGSGNQVFMQALDFFGPTAINLATIVDAGPVDGQINNSSWPSSALTIPTDGDLIIEIGAKPQPASPTDMGAIGCPSDVNGANPGNRSNASAFELNEMVCYVIQTTKANIAGNNFTAGSGNYPASNSGRGIIAFKQQDAPTGAVNPIDGPVMPMRVVR
jgi:hypothetical protein